MKNILYIIVIFIPLFYSCNENNNNKQQEDVLTIPLFYSKDDRIKLSEFTDEIELFFPETTDNSMIENPVRFDFTENKLFVGSAHTDITKILAFDLNGNFLSAVDNQGGGPQEYLEIMDYTVYNDSIVAFGTYSDAKILTYNINTNTCTDRVKLDFYPRNLVYGNEELYIYHRGVHTSGNRSDWQYMNNVIIKMDKEGTIKSAMGKPDRIMHNKIMYVSIRKTLSLSGDEVFFYYPFSDIIYKIESDQLVPYVKLDFGKNKIPDKVFEGEPGILEIRKRIIENRTLFLVEDYMISPEGISYAFFDYEENGYVAFYNFQAKKTSIAHTILDDMFFIGERYAMKSWQTPRFTGNQYLIWPVTAGKMKKMYEEHKKDPGKWQHFKTYYQKYIPEFEKLGIEDNPVLVRIKIKYPDQIKTN